MEKIQKHEQNGLRSYKKLYIWSVDISSNAKQLSMNQIMNPERAKSEEELADAIEKWDRDQTELAKVDPGCELPEAFKLPAFKNMLPPRVLEFVETQMDSSLSDNYKEVRKRVYGWALKKRLEHKPLGTSGCVNEMDRALPQYLDAYGQCVPPPPSAPPGAPSYGPATRSLASNGVEVLTMHGA